MLNDASGFDHIFIACGFTDLRNGIDGLSGIVEHSFRLDPYTNCLFLFCGRRNDRIKALLWEGDGFLLLYKRLETGRYQWPRTEQEVRELTPQQFRWLTEGLKTEQKKVIPKLFINGGKTSPAGTGIHI
jgi:transposase